MFVSANLILNILFWVMWYLWIVLYCINCRFVLVVIEKIFSLICIQKSGLGERAKSFSHLVVGSDMEVPVLEISLYNLEMIFFEFLNFIISSINLDGCNVLLTILILDLITDFN